MPADEGGKEKRHEADARRFHPPPEVEGGWFGHILASSAAAEGRQGGTPAPSMSSSPRRRPRPWLEGGGAQQSLRDDDSASKVSRPSSRLRNQDGENDEEDEEDEDDTKVREGYRRRLATYTPHNYFGKPPSISPVVCARFGWKVKENDVLECEDCGATFRVEFPSSRVQGRAAARLTERYEVEVSTRHRDASKCRRFGTEARLYREEMLEASQSIRKGHGGASWERRRLLPHAFVPMVARATRRLWDDPVQCGERFCREYVAVRQALTESLPSDDHQWSWSIPDGLREYRPEADPGVIGSGTYPYSWFVSPGHSSSLLLRIIEAVDPINSGSSPPEVGCVEELSAALVLFGWCESLLEQQRDAHRRSLPSPSEDAGASEAPTSQRNLWRLTCPFTLSVLTLVARERQTGSVAGREAGQEMSPGLNNDVFKAHRYYSPYVCGFPITTDSRGDGSHDSATALPIWKCLAARLLRVPAVSQPTTHDALLGVDNGDVPESHTLKPYEAFEQALSVLRSTVSPRLKRQRLHSSDVVPT